MDKASPRFTRSLFVFCVLYGGMTCIAGVLGNKQVAIGPLSVEAGIFPFLMLVILSSAVAEMHGRETANRLVVLGFVPLLVSMLLIIIVLLLPSAPDMQPERLDAFQLVLAQSPRLMAAGICSYGVSQFLNVYVFSALRQRGGMLWLRSAVASILSQIVDTLIFVTLAFYGVFPILELLAGQMIAKMVLSAIMVPLLVYAFVALGRRLDAQEVSAAA